MLLGLTGGIAAGKSTVAAMFAARGAIVIDADCIGHELQAPGTPCYREIVASFGHEILDPAGRIDRRRLGAQVFGDAAARTRLEAIMHPAIWAACWERARAAAAAGERLCLVDAALILEAGMAEHFDAIILVRAPDSVQLARLRSRGLDEAEARRRLEAQWPAARKAAQADFVIETAADLASTEAQVAAIHHALLQDPRAAASAPADSSDRRDGRPA